MGNLIASVRKTKGLLDSLSKNSDTLNLSHIIKNVPYIMIKH
jgi:hypothetical protein